VSEPKFIALTPELHDYVVSRGAREDAALAKVRESTAALGDIAVMQISPDQGALMTMLARLIGARRAIELGTFTGYSALCIARGLPADGHLLCCDVSGEWTAIARRFFEKAGVAHRIELRLAPGIETLRALPATEDVDLAFIDADKPSYPLYYEEILRRMRPGGLLLADNVLWLGRVADPAADDEQTRAIRSFNELVARDERVDRVMLPIADGLTIARKR
jgi:caffeoyl-CoA O-methyltransferase